MADNKADNALKDAKTNYRADVALEKGSDSITGKYAEISKEVRGDSNNPVAKESVKLSFRTYDKYGHVTVKDIDITDLVRQNIGDDLRQASNMFVGFKYSSKEGVGDTLPAYRHHEGTRLKERMESLLETAIVNQRQLEAIDKLMIGSFNDFNDRMFNRFWLD